MEHAFWGPQYSDTEQKAAVAGSGYDVEEFQSVEAMIPAVAELIANGAVVGWYQGRSE